MNPIRFGLLGASSIAERSFAPAVKNAKNSSLVAVAARDFSKAKIFADKLQVPRVFATYEEMVTSDEIDAVYISLPNHLHTEWAMRSLQSGKHVIVEKPIATSAWELERLFAHAEKKRHVVMEAFMFRFNERIRKVKELVDDGLIGDVLRIHADFSIPLFNRSDIRFLDQTGAGSLEDVGTYPIALAETVLGTWPTEIFCVLSHIALGHKADNHFSGVLGFPGGKKALFSGGFESQFVMDALIIGSKGMLILQNFVISEVDSAIILKRGETFETIQVQSKDQYQLEIEDFVSTIRNEKKPLLSKALSLNHRKVIDLCHESSKKNRTIKVNPSFYFS